MKKKMESKLTAQAPFRNPKTDPQGSYTGTPEQPGEKPVQDADDL